MEVYGLLICKTQQFWKVNEMGHLPSIWNEIKFIDHDPCSWYKHRVKEAIPIRLTYVQDWMQVLFNTYFMFDWVF